MLVVSLSNQWQNRLDKGQIIGEVQKGYKLSDRVLRPALVLQPHLCHWRF